MTTRHRAAAAVLTVLAAVFSVTFSLRAERPAPTPRHAPSPSAATTGACAPGGAGGGTGYAMTGDYRRAVVRPITLCPLSMGAPILAPDVPEQKVSWLTGTGTRAVVAEYGTGTDRLAQVTDDGLVPVPELGAQVGHSPALAPDGRIAWIERALDRKGTLTFGVRVFDPATRTRTTLYRIGDAPTSLAWGPDGRLALIASQGGVDPHLIVIGPKAGTARRVADVSRSAVGVFWLPSGAFVVSQAVTQQTGGAVLLSADGRKQRDLSPQWSPVGVTPDGALLAFSRTSSQLARFAGPDYAEPEVFGTLPTDTEVWQVVV